MKTNYLYLAFILILIHSCKKDDTEPHVFERGQIVSSKEMSTRSIENIKMLLFSYSYTYASQINYKHNVKLYSIVYETVNPKGEETTASGLLAVPENISTAIPLMSFQHGTILKDDMVPSKTILGSGFEIGLIFGTEGYAVCIPDYLGLGEGEGLHPYMHAKSEATATIDMIRAAKNKLKELGIELTSQLFLSGYSQGAHATMATHKAIEQEYSGEFSVTASAPMSGPYDVSGVMANIVLRKEPYIYPGFLPYMLYSYNPIYGIYDNMEENFKSPYNSKLPIFFDGNNAYSLMEVNEVMPDIPSDIFTDEAYRAIMDSSNTKVWEALKDNDLYDWVPIAPIRMFHCNGDITVPIENAQKALETFTKNGVDNAELVNPLEGGTHATCVFPSLLGTRDWFATFLPDS